MTAETNTSSRARRVALALIAAALVLAVVVAGASATVSDEATTFGADGVAAQNLGIHYSETGFSGVYARPDGSLFAQQGTQVESYAADGTPAPRSEGSQGTYFPAGGGKSFLLSKEVLTRLEPDGTPDPSFGEAGTVKAPYGAGSVAELASGKVVATTIVGEGARNFQIYAKVAVLNSDGSPDPAAGSSRVVPQNYSGYPIREIVPTPEGGALVVSSTFMLELGPDGTANSGFGENGLLTKVPILAGAHFLPDGSIEAVGMAYVSSEKKRVPAVVRYTAAGQPETSFGDGGERLSGLQGWTGAAAASWGADGSVIVGGRAEAPGPCPEKECEEAPVLAAFDAAGNLETGFGEGGVLRLAAVAGLPHGYASTGVEALTRRPDGSIVAAGSAPPNESVAFLAAFSPQGSLLSSFGEGGVVKVREAVAATQTVTGLVPVAGGKLLAAGATDVGSQEHPILARYNADGSLDPSFGDGAGYVSLAETRGATGFAVRGDLALVGSYDYPRGRLLMARTSDGETVSSFGSGGLVMLPSGLVTQGLAFASDGDPLVLASHYVGEGAIVLRLDPDGSPDGSFGHGGRLRLSPPGGGQLKGRAIVAGPGGRTLVGALAGNRFAIAGLLPDGRLDRSFGSGGWALTRVPGSAESMMLVRAGSHLYLAGVVKEGGHSQLVLSRFDADGRLDKSFGKRGRRTARLESSQPPTAILPTPRGVVVTFERGSRPVLTFAPGKTVWSGPVNSKPQDSWHVHATVSQGRLIVGWSRLSKGTVEYPTYFLSARPLAR